MKRLIIHAPGVNTGGGYVLLKALLEMPSLQPFGANLDTRVLSRLKVPDDCSVYSIDSSISSRIKAELRLRKIARPGDLVLCFHGLPPLLHCSGHVSVFVQNRLNLGESRRSFVLSPERVKSSLKQLVFRLLQGNVDEYIVQTPSMLDALSSWCGKKEIPIRMLPFLDDFKCEAVAPETVEKKYNFIYVADGLAHKNHHNLLLAWIRLAKEGIYPSLMLTLGERDHQLLDQINQAGIKYSLNISNSGDLNRDEIFALYRQAQALVFPSTCESFGIPLIEASFFGLPIVASELDYIRDVSVPCETFDPNSPVSISRSIKRFLGISEEPLTPCSTSEFVGKLLK